MYIQPVLGEITGKKPIMALSVDKIKDKRGFYYGIARVITNRRGHPDIPGFIDKSKLIIVKSNDLFNWERHSDLQIKGIDEVINLIPSQGKYFIGLEDPDVVTDPKTRLRHVYFTIAFKLKEGKGHEIYLGHAYGKDLENLTATAPLLGPMRDKGIYGFKESTIIPRENLGYFVLNEVLKKIKYGTSLISISTADSLEGPFKFQKIILHPEDLNYPWCEGELSPCTIFSKDFVKYKNLFVGIANGRKRPKMVQGKRVSGKFRPGLFLFDPRTGEIPWVDEECLLEDPDASTITFASDFIQISKEKGILYSHPNDSFVRAYEIDAKGLKEYLKNKVKSLNLS
jgi:hypothetical protein